MPRDALIAVLKCLAEARASEVKTILGWEVNTRHMTVSLPPDKHRAWTSEIQSMRTRPGRRATAKELESTIERLSCRTRATSWDASIEHARGRRRTGRFD